MRFVEPTQRELELLPFTGDGIIARAKHRTARAVIQPVGSEVRIPSIGREQRGDFKRLMNRMAEELDHTRFRFVAIDRDDELAEIWEILGPPNAKDLEDVLHGFERETLEEYEDPEGEIVPVETLVGDWDPEKYQ